MNLCDIYRPDDWRQICSNVAKICHQVFPYIPKKPVRSAILSSLFESQAASHFCLKGIEVHASQNDREPDLFIKATNLPCEIKVTGLDTESVGKNITWLGGRYSKRNSDYVFIGWKYFNDNNLFGETYMKFFVLKTYLIEEDWKELSKSKDYYGVGFKSSYLQDKEFDVLVGNYMSNTFIMERF